MAELIALGKNSQRQSRWEIHEGETLLVGRAPRQGWAVPWDRLISREHANITLVGGQLRVEELETARNPILLNGKPNRRFTIEPDGRFRIGDTTFHYHAASEPEQRPSRYTEHLLDADPGKLSFANPAACLQALCKMPAIISDSCSNENFAERVVDLLLESLPGSLAAAVMQYDDATGRPAEEPCLIRWTSRDEEVARFRPSRRLIQRAFERWQSVVHVWVNGDTGSVDLSYTINDDFDWAFCTPVAVDASQRWCLYVSGRRQLAGVRDVEAPEDLIGDLRLAELIGKFVGAVRRVRALEQHQSEMRQFFSPAVVETLTGASSGDPLEPRLGPVAVLFCDVRGFSRKVEESSSDLRRLLEQVSESLTVMTRSILKFEGVIADFQGDATLGFWGWPQATPDAALFACRAALRIQSVFDEAERDPMNPLHGYRVGIGVAFGEAIAGRIGSHEQIKVGVFGPVVNLASRLQDLTKQVGAPILVDAGVVGEVGKTMPDGAGVFRRLARLRPPGMNSAADIYSLTPGAGAPNGLTSYELSAYQTAVDAVINGDWAQAGELLETLPKADGPSHFLKSLLTGAGFHPPRDWDGALTMAGKGEVRLRSGQTMDA